MRNLSGAIFPLLQMWKRRGEDIHNYSEIIAKNKNNFFMDFYSTKEKICRKSRIRSHLVNISFTKKFLFVYTILFLHLSEAYLEPRQLSSKNPFSENSSSIDV